MTACMVARVNAHREVADLAAHSSVPVINALSNDFHPLQTIADFQTIHESFPSRTPSGASLGLEGLKVAWVGDSNNVLFDLAVACVKMGVDISVASPQGYGIPDAMRTLILSAADGVPTPGQLVETTVPEEAIKDADILVTDTWVSMGQEAEAQKRLKAFAGYQVTNELAKRGGAKPDWKFMHCLPRHPEEVDDEVFYGPRSLVFPEAENRLWAAVGTWSSEAFGLGGNSLIKHPQLPWRPLWSTKGRFFKRIWLLHFKSNEALFRKQAGVGLRRRVQKKSQIPGDVTNWEKVDRIQLHYSQKFSLLIHEQSVFPIPRRRTAFLAGGQLAGVDNFVCLLQRAILVGPVQRGTRQCHETGASRFQDAKGTDELEERVYPRRLRRPRSDMSE